MNDLMTKSFLSYVELKKQAERGVEEEATTQLNPAEEHNLSVFYQEVAAIKSDLMEEITNLLHDLQSLNEEAKSAHSAKILRGLRDRMDSDIVSVLRKARLVKSRLESLHHSNEINRRISTAFAEGTHVDRTRIAITNGLRVKLRDLMNGFQSLREKIVSDHKQDLRRRYYYLTGEIPCEEAIEKMVSGSMKMELFEGKTELDLGNRVRHEAVMDIQRSLNKLHQVFLDMAVLVEAQGEKMDDIELNVANAGSFVCGGTDSLYYANQMKKKNRKWICWVLAVVLIILVVCIISMLTS